ncbi:MAG: hypothetical protein H0U63_07860 [Burkholderiales bacterium]|nr:hypothetical protein [Burkholderiales bacterium]
MAKIVRAFAIIAAVVAITKLVKSEMRSYRPKREYSALDLHRWEDEGGNIPEVETIRPKQGIAYEGSRNGRS